MAKKKTTTINTVFGERTVAPHENAEAYAKFHKRVRESMKPGDLIEEIRSQIFADQNWHYAQYETLRGQLLEKLQGWQHDPNALLEFAQVISKLDTVDRLSREAVKFSNDVYAGIEERRERFADRKPDNGEQSEAPAGAEHPSNDNVKTAAMAAPAALGEPQEIAEAEARHAADTADQNHVQNASESSAQDVEQDLSEEGAEPALEQTAYETDDLTAAQTEEAADVTETAEQPDEDAA